MAEPALPGGIQPLGLEREAAAAYCGMTPDSFDAAVRRGILPQPLPTGGRRRIWHRDAPKSALDELAGIAQPSPEQEALRRVRQWRGSR